METVWFWLVALMLVMYVVLDGFDLGAGILHLIVAKNETERRQVLRSIGPVWDGNEVWLLAAGGTLYFAFPALYASSFSGFYLPLMMVLWLLILRGISIEFRSHIESPVWKPLWDVVFSGSSALLAVFFGAALGNVVRGVPLDASGTFFEPLWTDFRLSARTGILDWFTVTIGLVALAALAVHGALWLMLKTEGELRERARRAFKLSWYPLVALSVAAAVLTYQIQPQVRLRLAEQPAGHLLALLALAGLVGMRWLVAKGAELRAFLASAVYLAGMLGSVAFGLYPYVLPAITDPALGLTVHSAKAADYGLKIGLAWWIPGMILASLYFTFVYRQFRGKVQLEDEGY